MPIELRLPASVGDDPELIEHPIYRRAVPADVPAYVETRAPGVDPECVVFVWPDGAEAVWDANFGWSVPRVPSGPPKLPATVEEAEAKYQIKVACGVPEAEARKQLEADIERIRAKAAELERPEDSHDAPSRRRMSSDEVYERVAQAMKKLAENPRLTLKDVANLVGLKPGTLKNHKLYKAAKHQRVAEPPPRGFVAATDDPTAPRNADGIVED